MRRRGFLGIMGGAAVAGPSIAKEAVAKMPIGLGDIIVHGAPTQGMAAASIGSDKVSRIAQLKRLISGELSDEEKAERRRQKLYQRHQLVSQEVACLRSVSGVRKLDMYQERVQRVQDEINNSHHQTYLERLLAGKSEYENW